MTTRKARCQVTRGGDRPAQVDAHQELRAGLGGNPQVAAHAAAGIEHHFAGEVRLNQPGSIAERRAILLGPDDPVPIPLEVVGGLGAPGR